MIGRILIAGVFLAAVACSANQLAPAQDSNLVDTVTLGAIFGAPIQYPAAYDITTGLPVRTDQSPGFDFIYNVDSLGRHVLLPLHAIDGLGNTSGSNPGFIRSTKTFEQVTSAPSDGYLTTDTLVIAPGDVLIARSRIACYLGVPQYAKFQVIDFADSNKTVRLQALADINCGYKNLQPGVPQN